MAPASSLGAEEMPDASQKESQECVVTIYGTRGCFGTLLAYLTAKTSPSPTPSQHGHRLGTWGVQARLEAPIP